MNKQDSAPSGGTTKFLSIAPRIGATNWDESIEFYKKLGFQVAYKDEGFMIINREGINIQFNLFEESDDPKKSVCYIGVTGIDAFYEHCLSNNIVRYQLNETNYGTKDFGVCDPIGNLTLFSEDIETMSSKK
jgi:hypothetical protein